MLGKFLNLFKSSPSTPSLTEIASRMGIERRTHYRAIYPTHSAPFVLPEILFEGFAVQAKDISEGGFCIHSNALTDKLSVGQTYEFELNWTIESHKCKVTACLIGVSFQKIHFQTKSIDDLSLQRLAAGISLGSRGSRLTPSFLNLNKGIVSDFREIWSNPLGDKIIFKKTENPWAEGTWIGASYQLQVTKGAVRWPKNWGLAEKSGFLTFLVNAPAPSTDLKLLIAAIEQENLRREIA